MLFSICHYHIHTTHPHPSNAEDEADVFLADYLTGQKWIDDGAEDEAPAEEEVDESELEDSEIELHAQERYQAAYAHRDQTVMADAEEEIKEVRERRSKRKEKRAARKLKQRAEAEENKEKIAKEVEAKREVILAKVMAMVNDQGLSMEKLRGHPIASELGLDAEEEGMGGEEGSEWDEEKADAVAEQHAAEYDLDPVVEAELDRALEELYAAERPDYIPGVGGVRFKYATVDAEDFGMDLNTLMFSKDEELDNAVPMQALAPYVQTDDEVVVKAKARLENMAKPRMGKKHRQREKRRREEEQAAWEEKVQEKKAKRRQDAQGKREEEKERPKYKSTKEERPRTKERREKREAKAARAANRSKHSHKK
ncbi:hypothetical protein KIPB_000964 [Kipferlia bialata]|uniref:Kri1-like C-terminal domain-containing protein n=1 Tax=Kipferlia bialata TaxID=797122 RepID=A0A9K3GDV0_9EUKA|nr:hypothetical protein KIPB_000964 [Kipferlia bialata]|eukprot:g964.t1